MESRWGFDLTRPANLNIEMGIKKESCYCENRLIWGQKALPPWAFPGFFSHPPSSLMHTVGCLHNRVYSSRERVCPFCIQQVSLLRLTAVRFDLSGSFISWWHLEKPYLLKMNPGFQLLSKHAPQFTLNQHQG